MYIYGIESLWRCFLSVSPCVGSGGEGGSVVKSKRRETGQREWGIWVDDMV
jgi:hypothetical protein